MLCVLSFSSLLFIAGLYTVKQRCKAFPAFSAFLFMSAFWYLMLELFSLSRAFAPSLVCYSCQTCQPIHQLGDLFKIYYSSVLLDLLVFRPQGFIPSPGCCGHSGLSPCLSRICPGELYHLLPCLALLDGLDGQHLCSAVVLLFVAVVQHQYIFQSSTISSRIVKSNFLIIVRLFDLLLHLVTI